MKKLLSIFLISCVVFLTLAGPAKADNPAPLCDESRGGTEGLVPCGKNLTFFYMCRGTDQFGDPITWSASGPGPENAQAACREAAISNTLTSATTLERACRCEFAHVFILLLNIYRFIVWNIATPLAALLIVVGGTLILLSGASQKLHALGKSMLWSALIGLVLIFGSYFIIDVVLRIIGVGGLGSPF